MRKYILFYLQINGKWLKIVIYLLMLIPSATTTKTWIVCLSCDAKKKRTRRIHSTLVGPVFAYDKDASFRHSVEARNEKMQIILPEGTEWMNKRIWTTPSSSILPHTHTMHSRWYFARWAQRTEIVETLFEMVFDASPFLRKKEINFLSVAGAVDDVFYYFFHCSFSSSTSYSHLWDCECN